MSYYSTTANDTEVSPSTYTEVCRINNVSSGIIIASFSMEWKEDFSQNCLYRLIFNTSYVTARGTGTSGGGFPITYIMKVFSNISVIGSCHQSSTAKKTAQFIKLTAISISQ